MSKKKNKDDVVTRIQYSPKLRLTVGLPNNTTALIDTNLFKRTDNLEDGSESTTYGFEIDKELYKKLRKALGG